MNGSSSHRDADSCDADGVELQMSHVGDLNRLLSYDCWANCALAKRLGEASPGKALSLLAHIFGMHRLWQARVRGEAMAGTWQRAMWPPPRPSKFASECDDIRDSWSELLEGRDPKQTISYTDLAGRERQTSLADAVVHIALHGSFHRGQISLLIGSAKHPAPDTGLVQAIHGGGLDACVPIDVPVETAS